MVAQDTFIYHHELKGAARERGWHMNGNKEGAIQAMRSLEADGLGQLEEVGSSHFGNIVSL